MAEAYVETGLDGAERHPIHSPTFSSFRDQSKIAKLTAFLIARMKKDTPPASKPIPPLEPLNSSLSPSATPDLKKRRPDDAGCEPDHRSMYESRDVPSSLLTPSPPGEDRDDLHRHFLVASQPAIKSEQDCGGLFSQLLSPPLSVVNPSEVPSPISVCSDSPRTPSAFREVSPSFGSLENVPLPVGVAQIGRKRRRSFDGDGSESCHRLRAMAKQPCWEGAALDLSPSAQAHPVPSDPLSPACPATQRAALPYGLASRSESHAQPRHLVAPSPAEGRSSGLVTPARLAGYPTGQQGGVAYPASQQGSVIHLADLHAGGVAHVPSQQPQSVARVPSQHPQSVAHLPGHPRGVIAHTTDPVRGATPTWNLGTPGTCPVPRQVMPNAYFYDLNLQGGRQEAPNSPLHLRALLQPRKTYPSPLFHASGNQSRRMSSEISYGYPSPHNVPTSSLHMPSASSKKYEWSRSKCEVKYTSIPVAKWTNANVVEFIYDAIRKLDCEDDQVYSPLLTHLNGSSLLELGETGFRHLCKKDGDKIHGYFQDYIEKKEKRQIHAESHPHYLLNSHPYSSAFNVNGDKCTHHPHLDPRETAAPYELRYNIDYRGPSFDDKSGILLSDKLPSAAFKSFAPFTAKTPPGLSNGTIENISDPEQSTSEEEPRPEPPKKRGPGRPRKPENELKKKKKRTGRLWEFIRNLLHDPTTCPSLVCWENAEEGTFKFVQAEKVAQKWGDRKHNTDMNYEKLSRAMRYYYKTNIFEAVLGRRLVYKFGKNAKDWKPSNPNFTNLQTH